MASSKKAIYAAILGNLAISITKFIASAISGSTAMFAEGIHSLVDTGNGGLLLFGINRSKRRPDETHPYGYGKEVYFYTLMVAVLIFGLGGGVSLYEGIKHVYQPAELGDPTISYLVLSLAIVFEGIVWWIAWKEFKKLRGDESNWSYIRGSKDPTTFAVLFEDTAALAGLAVALVGIYCAHKFNMPVLDGVASVIIGVILCVVASILLYESKGLLIGEGTHPETITAIRRMTRDDPAVHRVVRALTMHMGPEQVLLTLDINFNKDLSSTELEHAVDRLEHRIRAVHPEVKHIFIEAESFGARRVDGKPVGGADDVTK
ncbi:MAG: cation diffusion facilitator family transporter [Gammaproteobacteria bacterium]|nr:cation diffusion facilitator family transporter [Gammaproteobacteria bacterium]